MKKRLLSWFKHGGVESAFWIHLTKLHWSGMTTPYFKPEELLRPACKGSELVHRKVVVCVCTAPRFFIGEDFLQDDWILPNLWSVCFRRNHIHRVDNCIVNPPPLPTYTHTCMKNMKFIQFEWKSNKTLTPKSYTLQDFMSLYHVWRTSLYLK